MLQGALKHNESSDKLKEDLIKDYEIIDSIDTNIPAIDDAQKKDANKLKYINRSDDTAGNLGYKSDESQGKSQSKLENLYKNQNTDFIKEYDDLKDVLDNNTVFTDEKVTNQKTIISDKNEDKIKREDLSDKKDNKTSLAKDYNATADTSQIVENANKIKRVDDEYEVIDITEKNSSINKDLYDDWGVIDADELENQQKPSRVINAESVSQDFLKSNDIGRGG